MKIVHYLSEVVLAHGGVVRSVLDLTAALARAEHEVHLLCFDATDVPKEWRRGGPLLPKAVVLDRPVKPKPIRAFKPTDLLRAEASILGARTLHLHGPWESTNLQLAKIAWSHHVPYVVSTHGMLDDWTIAQGLWKKKLFLRLVGKRMLDRAACVLCTATAERTQASKWHACERSEVLPLIMDMSPFAREPSREETEASLRLVAGDGPVILFLSRLHPKKGLEHLIDAASLLKAKGLAFRLVIAGGADAHAPGYDQAMRERVRAKGLEDRTAFLGLVVGAGKSALYHAARVCVLPTSQENWGFVPLESLACGGPVVTTKGVDIWPELEASGGAIITEQRADALASAVEPLLRDEARARAMGEAGRAWVRRELEPGAVIRRYEELYRELRAHV